MLVLFVEGNRTRGSFSAMSVAFARLSDSIMRTYLNEQSENKTRATWERGLSPAPARFSHFFLLNDFSPLSRSLEQATMSGEYKGKGLDFRAQPSLTKLCCVIHSSISCHVVAF